MSAESKEQQKYLATWLNTLSAGSFVAGVITPVAAFLNGTAKVELSDPFLRGLGLWIAVGLVLHFLVIRHLGLMAEKRA